jgi:phosphoribosylanthranilate isomerase
MALKTLVKVGQISNLSDARYCSGMGVDMLGFGVIPGQPHYVSPEQFKEIRGWFSGPAVVAEAHGIENRETLEVVIQHYAPDFIELTIQDLLHVHVPSSSFILASTYEEVMEQTKLLAPLQAQIAKVIVPASTGKKALDELAQSYEVMLRVDSEMAIEAVLNNASIKGIALQGSQEEKPGLKNYDQLSGILEKLEEEN